MSFDKAKAQIFAACDKGKAPGPAPPLGVAPDTSNPSKSAKGQVDINASLTVGPIIGVGVTKFCAARLWGIWPLSVLNASNSVQYSNPAAPFPNQTPDPALALVYVDAGEGIYWLDGAQLDVDVGFTTLIEPTPYDPTNGCYVNPPNVYRTSIGQAMINYPGVSPGSLGQLTPAALAPVNAALASDGGFAVLICWYNEDDAEDSRAGLVAFPYDGGAYVEDGGDNGGGGNFLNFNPPVSPTIYCLQADNFNQAVLVVVND